MVQSADKDGRDQTRSVSCALRFSTFQLEMAVHRYWYEDVRKQGSMF